MSEKYSIIDIETTGGSRNGHKITEIAIINLDGDQVVDSYSTLINPERFIPKNITYLTGIDDAMVANAPKFYEVAKKIVEMPEGRIFVAHNVFFDFNFIKHEFLDLGYSYQREKLCTVRLARKILPGHASYSLGKICNDLGIEIESRHRAMGDAQATVKLFQLLLQKDQQQIDQSKVNEGKKIVIPPQLDRAEYENLPNAVGVYYFYDLRGELLYIGKSKDIKKRVASHFRPDLKRRKDIQLKNAIAHIDYKLTGNELAALLIESHEIKTLRPIYNVSLRRKRFPIALDLVENKEGILEIKAFHRTQAEDFKYTFSNKKAAHNKRDMFYQSIFGVEADSILFESTIKMMIKTLGTEKYNQLVQKVFMQGLLEEEDFLLKLPGLKKRKSCLIKVENRFPKILIFEDESELELIQDQDMKNILFNYIQKYKPKITRY